MVMNTLKNGEDAFEAVRILGSRIGWTERMGYGGSKIAQTNPVSLPGLEVPEGYEPGTAYGRVYATSQVEFLGANSGYEGRVHAIRGISIGAERGFDMDTAIFEQVEIDDHVQPDENTLETLSKWVTRISEVIDQK